LTVAAVHREGVIAAIRQAGKGDKADFGYLMATAKRESGLDPSARAKGSSAHGLFQFTEQTWLRMMKNNGAENGFAEEAGHIDKGPGGKLVVTDSVARQRILDLRTDPKAASAMAAALASDNRSSLRGSLGREPSNSEVYMAHFLGARGAADMFSADQTRGSTMAADLLPAAANANRSVFYDGGRARTVTEVRDRIESGFEAAYNGIEGEDKGIATAATGKGPDAVLKAATPFRNLVTDLADMAILAGLKLGAINRDRGQSAYLEPKQKTGSPVANHIV
jgi:hypothetical protein